MQKTKKETEHSIAWHSKAMCVASSNRNHKNIIRATKKIESFHLESSLFLCFSFCLSQGGSLPFYFVFCYSFYLKKLLFIHYAGVWNITVYSKKHTQTILSSSFCVAMFWLLIFNSCNTMPSLFLTLIFSVRSGTSMAIMFIFITSFI